jgi:hypothetical protein
MQGRASIYADTVEAKGMRDSLYADAKVVCSLSCNTGCVVLPHCTGASPLLKSARHCEARCMTAVSTSSLAMVPMA